MNRQEKLKAIKRLLIQIKENGLENITLDEKFVKEEMFMISYITAWISGIPVKGLPEKERKKIVDGSINRLVKYLGGPNPEVNEIVSLVKEISGMERFAYEQKE
ncbi:MAG: hypothetical protein QXP36_00280 [Conexivisphaerales archaeon]